jgi:hypothetical protein
MDLLPFLYSVEQYARRLGKCKKNVTIRQFLLTDIRIYVIITMYTLCTYTRRKEEGFLGENYKNMLSHSGSRPAFGRIERMCLA